MKLLLVLIALGCFVISALADFYQLLGVSRDANVKEIRKAFKSLAVKFHPDKNQDDENAEEKFIKIARAYEVLKDPDARKHYDVFGEDTEVNYEKRQYHSYSYYRDQFGIYDEDPLIITLSKADYELNVLDNNQAWFVNFYSPNCHHCHELAPTWRKLAAEFEGVIRFAAVNCEDDWSLCYQLSIDGYPSLLYYEKEAHLYEGEKYRASRTFDRLKQFVLSKLKVKPEKITKEKWDEMKQYEWLLFLCGDDNLNCPQDETRLKLTAILEGIMRVGIIKDTELSNSISPTYKVDPIVYWHVEKTGDKIDTHTISGSDTKEILNNVLSLLPNPEMLNEIRFQEIRTELRKESENPWLLCFFLGTATDLDLQLKRLPSMIPNINLGMVHCGKSSSLCASLHVGRYPTWGVLKVGGAFEMHHGRDVLYEVVSFAKESVKSTNFHALSPADFHNIVYEGRTWFIDWYAPWCPPCRKLMPELKRASIHFEPEKVQFGTIDCTLHKDLCSDQGITSYPTVKLYNGSQTYTFYGTPSENGIVEFVTDMLNPIVITLDDSNFKQLSIKSKDELWIVNYFAPWCNPCQKLSPEWRRLAKQMVDFPQVKVAQVNCETSSEICSGQNVGSYPTIRLYPLGTKGLSSVAIYNGNRDLASMKRWILNLLPSPIISMNAKDFKEQILTKKYHLPWLVEFYAPWCGHCTHFEPEFRKVAERLEGHIRSAKIDCDAERLFCGNLYITGYPTLYLYLSPNDRREIPTNVASEIIKRVRALIEEKYKHDEL